MDNLYPLPPITPDANTLVRPETRLQRTRYRFLGGVFDPELAPGVCVFFENLVS
jgi:hypothetical protein